MEVEPIETNYKDEVKSYMKKQNPVVFKKIPFLLNDYGMSEAGKTTLLANMFLKNFDGLMGFFPSRNIKIYAKNTTEDVNIRAICEYMDKKCLEEEKDDEEKRQLWSQTNVQETFDPQLLLKEINDKREFFRNNPQKKYKRKYHQLWILDDQACDNRIRVKFGVFAQIGMQGRHQNISCWNMVQLYTALPNSVRSQVKYIIIHRIGDQDEREKIYENIASDDGGIALVKDLYNRSINHYENIKTGETFGFLLVINYINSAVKGRFWKCLVEPFKIKMITQ